MDDVDLDGDTSSFTLESAAVAFVSDVGCGSVLEIKLVDEGSDNLLLGSGEGVTEAKLDRELNGGGTRWRRTTPKLGSEYR